MEQLQELQQQLSDALTCLKWVQDHDDPQEKELYTDQAKYHIICCQVLLEQTPLKHH